MANEKSPLEGMTIDDFRRLTTDPMIILGRALAPAINAGLLEIKTAPNAKLGPNDYCPGCGDLSSWTPDLCPDCLAVNAT